MNELSAGRNASPTRLDAILEHVWHHSRGPTHIAREALPCGFRAQTLATDRHAKTRKSQLSHEKSPSRHRHPPRHGHSTEQQVTLPHPTHRHPSWECAVWPGVAAPSADRSPTLREGATNPYTRTAAARQGTGPSASDATHVTCARLSPHPSVLHVDRVSDAARAQPLTC